MHAVGRIASTGRARFEPALDENSHRLTEAAAGVPRKPGRDPMKIVRKVDGRPHLCIVMRVHVDVNATERMEQDDKRDTHQVPARVRLSLGKVHVWDLQRGAGNG